MTVALGTAPRHRVARDAVVAAASAALLVGFNALRIRAGLDGASLVPMLAAFTALGVAGVALMHAGRLRPDECGLCRPRLLPSAAGVAVCAAAFVAVVIASGATGRPGPGTLLSATLLYVGAVAPAEELVARGLLFGAVERLAGSVPAIAVSALVFAAAHVPVYGIAALPTMLAAGLLLGWLRAWSGSLAAPVAAHALADLVALGV